MRTGASRPLQCMFVVAGVLTAPRARAFVRETTGYTTGTPLAWSSGCVVVAVADPRSAMVAWQDLVSATSAAAGTWTRAAANCGGGFRFDVEKAAVGDLGVRVDGVNAVVFRTRNYCNSKSSMPSCDPLSLAITWLTFDNGRLSEADIEINGEAYDWGLHANAQAGIMDLQSALTHELGHVLGLDHNCYAAGFGLPRPVDDQGNPIPDCGAPAPSSVTSAVMNPASSYGVERRALSDDDTRGICALYSSGTSPKCQGSLTPSGGCALAGDDSSPRGWSALIVLAWFFYRRRGGRAVPVRSRGSLRAVAMI